MDAAGKFLAARERAPRSFEHRESGDTTARETLRERVKNGE
jgi:hypothetical protein